LNNLLASSSGLVGGRAGSTGGAGLFAAGIYLAAAAFIRVRPGDGAFWDRRVLAVNGQFGAPDELRIARAAGRQLMSV